MSSKRKADVQLTKDDEEEDESPSYADGGFSKAPPEVLRQRRILHAKRPVLEATETEKQTEIETKANAESQPEENESAAAKTSTKDKTEDSGNAFSGVKLVSNSKPHFGETTGFSGFGETAAAGTGVFGTSTGFRGFGSVAAESSSAFAFARSEDSTSAAAAPAAAAAPPAALFAQDFVVQSGEENETCVLEQRCKAYRLGKPTSIATTTTTETAEAPSVPPSASGFDTGDSSQATAASAKDDTTVDESANQGTTDQSTTQWLEVGKGPLRILESDDADKKPAFGRLVQRRQVDPKENPTALLINVLVGRETTVTRPDEKHVRVATLESGHTLSLLFKFTSAQASQQVDSALNKIIASSKSFFDDTTENGKGGDGGEKCPENGDEQDGKNHAENGDDQKDDSVTAKEDGPKPDEGDDKHKDSSLEAKDDGAQLETAKDGGTQTTDKSPTNE